MEDVPAYLERKTKEIRYLSRLAGGSEPAVSPRSVNELIEAKSRLRAELLAQATLAHADLTETDRSRRQGHRLGAFTLRYGYQRYDLSVEGPTVYPSLASTSPGGICTTVYAASGMAAISAVILALDRVLPAASVVAYRGSYPETQHLIAVVARNLSLHLADGPRALACLIEGLAARRRGPIVLLVDSYVADNWQRVDRFAAQAPVDLVLFDTTCYAACSSRIAALLAWTQRRLIPAVCLRSHLKLDCLGLEYGRLGSAVFVAPSCVKPAGRRLMRRIAEASEDNVRTLGSAALALHFPPFQGDAAFLALNETRVGEIRRNNRFTMQSLSAALGPAARFTRYHHDLFFTIEPRHVAPGVDIATMAAALVARLQGDGIPVRHCGSFGFDFIALDVFADAARQADVMRCAMADLPAPLVQRFVSATIAWGRRSGCLVRPRPAATAAGAAAC